MRELSKQLGDESLEKFHHLGEVSTETSLSEFNLNQMVKDLLVIAALP